jgi:type II secretory pathway pseudopilin PulG
VEDLRKGPTEERQRTLIAVLALALLVAVVGAAAFWADDQRWRQEAAAQEAAAQQHRQQVQQLQGQVNTLKAQARDLRSKAANPTLSIWNSCGGPCTVGPSEVRVGGVPDTFVFHVRYSATVPVSLYFFTFHQWSQYDADGCGFQLSCVQGKYDSYAASTSRDITFDKSTGCAGYVFVLASSRPGTISPDVEATYQPADHPTGVCAGHP